MKGKNVAPVASLSVHVFCAWTFKQEWLRLCCGVGLTDREKTGRDRLTDRQKETGREGKRDREK